jgi:hypothetical protein
VRRYSNGRYVQMVDNAMSKRFRASDDVWERSRYSSQKIGKNYHYTKPTSDPNSAFFKVRRTTTARYRVFARWPANSGYNNRTRIFIKTTKGWVSKVVNQRTDGGQWNYLGIYPMGAGDDWAIGVSSRSPSDGFIIADAVLVIRRN